VNEVLHEQLALLPGYLGGHLLLTLAALGTGIALALPLGMLVSRVRWLRGPALGVVSVVQTIPGLALLAFMVVALSRIGFVPAYIALTLYSLLPILRNTATGLDEVEPSVVEAARGIGMTPGQVLTRVRLPLAMPVIVAGIRTATVWTVGIATLSTPVGYSSLGNYIFSGLQTRNNTAVLVGCVAAAALALLLDGIVRLLEVAASRRSAPLAVAALASLAVVTVAGFAPSWGQAAVSGRTVVVGAKNFTEQYILAALIEQRLEDAGFSVERLDNLGSTVAFEALASGEIDCYVDYSGTLWANEMGRTGNPGAEAVLSALGDYLETEHGIGMPGALGFENAYALAMRADDAEARGIATIDDLVPVAPSLSIGSDYEFFSRPEWKSVREAYGLDFAEQRSLDPSLMYLAVAEGQVDVITAFSTDGRIIAYDLRVLADPREALPPYDAVLLLSPGRSDDTAFRRALRPLLGAIDDETMRRANMLVDEEKVSTATAVAFIEEQLREEPPPEDAP
jgi:osmoprotectant transport system permease protein